MHNYTIYNRLPANDWLESYVIGNGRMGASLMCGVSQEIIYLNEETIVSSRDNTDHSPEIYDKLQHIRNLLLEGRDIEADKYAKSEFSDEYKRIVSYGTAGLLKLSLHNTDSCENYRRELDLVNGKATISYDLGKKHFTRECFASNPDDIMVYRISCVGGRFCANVNYEYEKCILREYSENEFRAISETLLGNHGFAVGFRVESDGEITFENSMALVKDASYVIIICDIKTEFRKGEGFKSALTFPVASYSEILARHTEDFSELMKRADIELPKLDEVESISMHTRLLPFMRGLLPDGGIIAMQWQLGRYLLVSSSRNGCLPANLQGLWVNDLAAPWNADYHTNVNLQMNYWASETVNLSDCHMPLFDYMNDILLPSAKETAKFIYHSRGAVVHHLSNIYGFTGIADGVWGIWPMAAAWLAHHMWEHYLFTKDEKFLKEKAYEFIRQAAVFFIDNAVKEHDGYFATVPSTVPEHEYITEDENGDPYRGWVALNTTMDIETINMLMTVYEEASKILGIDDEDVRSASVLKEGLPPLKIGRFGQLREWAEDYDESDVGHNHIAHGYALFPFGTITRDMKEIRKAIEVSVERRTKNPSYTMGWCIIFPALMYARLNRGNDAFSHLHKLIGTCSSSSLLATFVNPGLPKGFQIDANFGFTAAVSEMLLQSYEGFISVLPALPTKWDHGSFHGFCARGGYTIDATWENFSVTEISVSAKFPGEVKIELPETQKNMNFVDDGGNVYVALDNKIKLNIGEKFHLTAMTILPEGTYENDCTVVDSSLDE